jgi:hypothetical protein
MLYQLSYLATRSALVQRSRGGPPGETVIIPCGREGNNTGCEFVSW